VRAAGITQIGGSVVDTELLEALRSEDPSAAEYLVDRYGDRAGHEELEVP
jgi:hypothetical protein